MNNNPIGVFDSGIGGLTVTKEIVKLLPNESIIYLGDTARVPYGTRGKAIIKKFALELARFLLRKRVKCLVVSCNTISATCLRAIEAFSSVPVLGVVEPAVRLAVSKTQNRRIGVIGTRATIQSNAYEKEIKKLLPSAKIFNQSGSLFIPLIEEGFKDHIATRQIAKDYLAVFDKTNIDVLILACTHFPLMIDIIQSVLGSSVKLVDCAKPTAKALKEMLQSKGLLANNLLSNNKKPKLEILVTDAPERVYEVSQRFWGSPLPDNIKLITLD